MAATHREIFWENRQCRSVRGGPTPERPADDASILWNREVHEDREDREGIDPRVESVARAVVDAGLQVHRALGPGLLESAYEHCLAQELHARGIAFSRQVALPIVHRSTTLDCGYRLDIVVENTIVLEIKAVEALTR